LILLQFHFFWPSCVEQMENENCALDYREIDAWIVDGMPVGRALLLMWSYRPKEPMAGRIDTNDNFDRNLYSETDFFKHANALLR
jgi:hypothetical protein